MNGDDHGNGKNGVITNALYRTVLIGICSWVLLATLKNNERGIAIEQSILNSKDTVKRIEQSLDARVTKPELDLAVMRIQNEQLKFQNEFLKITQPQMLAPPLHNKHTGK
jgi:hypothetical protein